MSWENRLPSLLRIGNGWLHCLLLFLSFVATSTRAHAYGFQNKYFGPSLAVSLGARFAKDPAPDLYQYPYFGAKTSLLSVQFSHDAYLALISPAFNYVGDLRFAFSVSPLAFHYASGFGIGLDLFTVDAARPGGVYGLTLVWDISGWKRYRNR